MAIPDFQSSMLPLMKYATDKNEHASREATDYLAQLFQLTDEEKETLLPSRRQTIIANRTYWALTHLKHAGLLETTKRGFFQITQRGMDVLQLNPTRIDLKFLSQYPEYIEFRRTSKKDRNGAGEIETEILSQRTPEELFEESYNSIRQELAQELIAQVKKASPAFFESLVVDLLVKMGYGGSRKDAGEAVGKSGDEGIDGIIKEDRLGLDAIYIQAKRWDERTVGSPDIQQFVGALYGKRAKKGIFITTSNFSPAAHQYVNNIDNKVVLIDGKQLAQLMIDFNVGVSRISTYEIKKIDTDYFTEM
ncbi:MAG TPA: restriction endonuclease [Ktedonobacteraceae bacterium]|nr:restriction endonuclease [Ktedonobacteraceae bacterium]